jgi:PAS domain S-box-containing protein
MGKVSHYVGTIENITEKRIAQEALRESEERYRSLVENIPIGIVRTTPDPKGRIVMANPFFLQIFGFESEKDLKNISMSDLHFYPKNRASF